MTYSELWYSPHRSFDLHTARTRKNCKCEMMNYGTLVKSSLGMAITNGLLNQPEIQVAKIHENA